MQSSFEFNEPRAAPGLTPQAVSACTAAGLQELPLEEQALLEALGAAEVRRPQLRLRASLQSDYGQLMSCQGGLLDLIVPC